MSTVRFISSDSYDPQNQFFVQVFGPDLGVNGPVALPSRVLWVDAWFLARPDLQCSDEKASEWMWKMSYAESDHFFNDAPEHVLLEPIA